MPLDHRGWEPTLQVDQKGAAMLRDRSKRQAHRSLDAGISIARGGHKPLGVSALVTAAIVSVLLATPATGSPLAAPSAASKTPRTVSLAVKPGSLPAGGGHVTLSGVTDPSRATFPRVMLRGSSDSRRALYRLTPSTESSSPANSIRVASLAATTPPVISSLAANPPFLTPQGGRVIVSATVSGASTCKLSASLLVSGLPETVDCSSGAVSTTITLPANLTTATKVYTITLTAVGSTTVKATTIVDVAGSGPAISGFSATPPSVDNAGGAIVLGASIIRAKSCLVSVAPAVSGLPETVACPGGAITVPVTLPANANSSATVYQFTLTATGTSTATAMTTVSVAGTSSGPVIDVSGAISANTTWSPSQASAYVIDGYIAVYGNVTLTIDPGTVVKSLGNGESCNGGAWANICVYGGGALDAIGTESQPIIFTSANDNSAGGTTGSGSPSPGDWAGITIEPNSGIDLEYAVVEYDGAQTGAGLYLQDSQPTLRNDTMENVNGAAYVLDSDGPFDNISGVTATGSGSPELDLVSGGVNTNTTLLDEPIPWVISGYLTVPPNIILTVAAGAVVKSLGNGRECNGGPLANICVYGGGALDAIGTESQPIIFTSANDNADKKTGSGKPSPGDWAGITTEPNSGIDLEYADVKYDGAQTGAGLFLQDSQPTLRNDTMENVNGAAYVLDSDGPFDNISGVTATGSGSPELDLVSGGVNTNTTLLDEPIPWVISGYLTVPPNIILTVAKGAVVKSLGNGRECNGGPLANICVYGGGALDAIGTESQPIIFTSANDNADKKTGSGKPSPGDWAGITTEPNSGIDLEYADVKYDGAQTGAGLFLQDSQPTLRNDTMENVNGAAYVLDSDGPFDNISGVTATGSGSPELDLVSGGVNTNTTLLDEPIPWVISGYLTVPPNITLTVAKGAVVKSLGNGAECNGGAFANICVEGTLIATGTSSSPVVFTSVNDNTYGNTGSGSPTPGKDWAGIDLISGPPATSSSFNYVVFEYAATAVSVAYLNVLPIEDSVFSYNDGAIAVEGTADNDPVLGALDCVPPYLSVIDASTDWFGSTGYPGASIDLLGLLGIIVPADFSSFYGAITTYGSAEESVDDNVVPWTLYTCPALFDFPIPISPVIFKSGPTYASPTRLTRRNPEQREAGKRRRAHLGRGVQVVRGGDVTPNTLTFACSSHTVHAPPRAAVPCVSRWRPAAPPRRVAPPPAPGPGAVALLARFAPRAPSPMQHLWALRDSNPRPQPCESVLGGFRHLGIPGKSQLRGHLRVPLVRAVTPCFPFVRPRSAHAGSSLQGAS